jgi:hypothetical protein
MRSPSPDNVRQQGGGRGYPGENEEAAALERWQSDTKDVRMSAAVGEQVLAFFEQHGVRSVVMTDRIIGCPHEEGIDYEGTTRATRSRLAVTVHP